MCDDVIIDEVNDWLVVLKLLVALAEANQCDRALYFAYPPDGLHRSNVVPSDIQ